MAENDNISDLAADVREQLLFLRELGVDTIDADLIPTVEPQRRAAVPASDHPVPRSLSPAASPPPIVRPVEEKAEPAKPFVSRLSSLPSLSNRPTPKRTVMSPPSQMQSKTPNEPMTAIEPSQASDPNTAAILSIREEIGASCTRCKLSTLGRTQVVNSVGNFSADLMFVGEAPGADEDIQGEPFVGRAGQLLTDIIEKGLQIPRQDVFIGNINRCRPPQNRAPEPDETIACKPFLLREIEVVKPRVIVVLGATAAHNLLETKVPIGKLRGQFHDYRGSKVMPTFHPAYLLRDPHKKREVWEDMKMVRDYLASTE